MQEVEGDVVSYDRQLNAHHMRLDCLSEFGQGGRFRR